jgi:periplasmic divalent cation tolerance protein
MLFIKTKSDLYAALERKIREIHPYTVPEILALPVTHGSQAYLDWLAKETL